MFEYIKENIDAEIQKQIKEAIENQPDDFPLNKLVKVQVTKENDKLKVALLQEPRSAGSDSGPDLSWFLTSKEEEHLLQLRKEQETRIEAANLSDTAGIVKSNNLTADRTKARMEIIKVAMKPDIEELILALKNHRGRFHTFNINELANGTPAGTTMMHYIANSKENNEEILAYLVVYEEANMEIAVEGNKNKSPLFWLKRNHPEKMIRYQTELLKYKKKMMAECVPLLPYLVERSFFDFKKGWDRFKKEFSGVLSKTELSEIVNNILKLAVSADTVLNVDHIIYLSLTEKIVLRDIVNIDQMNPEKLKIFNDKKKAALLILAQNTQAEYIFVQDTQGEHFRGFRKSLSDFENTFGPVNMKEEVENNVSLMHMATRREDNKQLNIEIILFLELRRGGDMQADSIIGTPMANLEQAGYGTYYRIAKEALYNLPFRYQYLLNITDLEEFKERLQFFVMDFPRELENGEYEQFIASLIHHAASLGNEGILEYLKFVKTIGYFEFLNLIKS